MNKISFLENIFVVNDDGSRSPVSVKYKTIIHQDYDTPVLVIEEEPSRVVIEIQTETKEHYNQIFSQIIGGLSTGVKSLAYNEWNPPPQHGRLIVDF